MECTIHSKCGVYRVQCLLSAQWPLQFTERIASTGQMNLYYLVLDCVQCIVYSLQFNVYCIQSTIYSVLGKMCTVQCTLENLQFTVFTVNCAA